MLGITSGLILLPFRYVLPEMSLLQLLILTAVLEEIFKCISVIIVTEKNFKLFDQVIDGIEYAITVALGFAFLENIVYLTEISEANIGMTAFWAVYFLRSVMTTLAHSIFTGTFGFAYANAYLLPDEFIHVDTHSKPLWFGALPLKRLGYALKLMWNILTLHIIFRHLLRNKAPRDEHTPNHLVLEGIMSAIYLHAVFNILVAVDIGAVAYPSVLPFLLLITCWGLVAKFGLRKYKQIIHRKFPPVEELTHMR